MVYFEMFNELSEFTDVECGQFFRDMLNYGMTGEVPNYQDRAMRTLWKSVQRRIDADGERYEEKLQKRAEAGRLGGLAKANNAKQSQASVANANNAKQTYLTTTTTTTTTPTPTTTTTPTKSMGADKPRTPARFVKPSVAEVEAYRIEQGLNLDAYAFIDYYDSVGWVIGKNKPMKDWKAAARRWARGDKKQGAPAQTAQKTQEDCELSSLVEYPAGSGKYIPSDKLPGGMKNAV